MKKLYLFLFIMIFMFIPKYEAKTYESEKLLKEENYVLNISENSAMNVILQKNEEGLFGIDYNLKFGSADSVNYKLEVEYYDKNNKILMSNFDTFVYKSYATEDSLYNKFKELSIDYDEIVSYKVKLDYNEFEIPEEKFTKRKLIVDSYDLDINVSKEKTINASYDLKISSKDVLTKYEFYIDKKSNPNDKNYSIKINNLKANYQTELDEKDDRYIITFFINDNSNTVNLKFSFDYVMDSESRYINLLNNHGNNMILKYNVYVTSKFYDYETKLYINEDSDKIEKIGNKAFSLATNQYFELNDKIYLNIILGREIVENETPIISDLINNFTFGDYDYNYIWVTFSFIAISILYLTLISLRNREKPQPDRNILSRYNSAELGYLYNKHVNNKHIISLIVWLCNKGYIKIVDLGYDFNVVKVKDYDGKDYIEEKFIKSVFAEKDEINLSKLLKEINYRYLKKKLTYSRMIHELYSRNYRLFGFVLDFLAMFNCFVITYFIIGSKYNVKEYLLYYVMLSAALALLVTKTIPLIFKFFRKSTQFSMPFILAFNAILLFIIGFILMNFKMVFSNYVYVIINVIQLGLICLSIIIIKSTCIFSDNAKNIMVELSNLDEHAGDMASKGVYKYLPVFFAIDKLDEYFNKINYDKFIQPEWFETERHLSGFGIRVRIRALFEMLNSK